MKKGVKYTDPEKEKVGIGATVEKRVKDLLKKEKNYSALINELCLKHYKLEKQWQNHLGEINLTFDVKNIDEFMAKIDLIKAISSDKFCPIGCPQNENKKRRCFCGLEVCLETIDKIIKEE